MILLYDPVICFTKFKISIRYNCVFLDLYDNVYIVIVIGIHEKTTFL